MLKTLRRGLLVVLAMLPLFAQAEQTAQQVVQQTVDSLLSDLKTNKANYKANPQAFYDTLNRILGPVVDSEGIAKGVMTVKYSRGATPEQIKRFEETFKGSLFQFYGNALLEYDNQTIRVLPSTGKQDPERTAVNMEVVGTNGAVYPVQYTMISQGGNWRLRNVIINGINIGKLFRDQFADSMQKNGNDLEKTIAGWGQVVARAQESAKGQKPEGGAQ
ncbi:ABC transporter substrate-binding protein [Pseudomonas sp. NY15181]|uniref:Tgt2/MlaC family protein n=1 Tax=Pseudomonas sp. NY15181 TaxID=3400349 RepID=UPI003A870EB8